MASEFDANEWIAGFPLRTIQKALFFVDIGDDGAALRRFGGALGCGRRQAEGVLEELVRRGFVVSDEGGRAWCTTEKGKRMSAWKPPRRLRPMIDRDDTEGPGNHGLEEVTCLLFAVQDDDEEVLEEARLQVNFWTQYEGEHLVEVSIFKPEDYDSVDSGGTVTESAYLSPAQARTMAAGLEAAAQLAEAEIARRALHPPKPRPSDPPAKAAPSKGTPRAEVAAKPTSSHPKDSERTTAQRTTKASKRTAVAATLAQLRGKSAALTKKR